MTYQCRRESCGREKYKITDNEPEHLKKLHISHDLFATGLKLEKSGYNAYILCCLQYKKLFTCLYDANN